MRIALLGDIHANLEALEAVLADAGQQAIDQIICTGDIVGYNADPVACLEKIREMGCPTVKGNHDEEAAGNQSLERMNPIAMAALQWTREQLSEEQRQWLSRLRMVRQVHDFTVVHSSLDQPERWNYVTNRFDAMAHFTHQFTSVCFHGHTHTPRIYQKLDKVIELQCQHLVLEPQAKYLINIGSVGQPRDGDWRASYAIYDREKAEVAIRRVEYDVSKAQRKILAADLPEALATRLEYGR